MTWLDAVPVVLVCAAWLILPGLPVSYALGLRGIAALATAPTITITVTAFTAVAAGKAGVHWSVPLVIGVHLVLALLAGLGSLLLRRRTARREPDPGWVLGAALLVLVPTAVLGAFGLVPGFGGVETLAQSFDSVFHYNVVASILDTGNASSLSLGSITSPSVTGAFYPAAWHDLVSLVVLSTGTSIAAATNLLAGVAALVAWPIGCMLLARQLFGRSPAAMVCTGVLSIAFTAFPWGLLGFGVLWPNTLGMAMAPVGLALTASIAGVAEQDVIGRGRAWLLLPLCFAGAGLAHPNVVFTMAALGFFVVMAGMLRRRARLRAEGRGARGTIDMLLVFLGYALVGLWVVTTPVFLPVRRTYWPPFESPLEAARDVLLNSPNLKPALWVVSVLVVVGAVLSIRRPALRWVVCAHALSGVLYVLTASVNAHGSQRLTGYWYNDSFRLAAMLPITGVPLAVAALVCAATALLKARPSLVPWLATGLTAVVVAATGGLYAREHADVLAPVYQTQGRNPDFTLVDDSELAFFQRVKDKIPAGSVVANDPWDGSALLWATTGRRVMSPQLGFDVPEPQKYLADHLVDAGRDPKVCTVAKQLGVNYMLIGKGLFWPWIEAPKQLYPGIADPGNRPGFRLVDSDGSSKLYQLTAC